MNADNTTESGEANRDRVLRFRVTEKEKTDIEAKAHGAGYKKTSDYLRTVGLGAEVKQAIPAELQRQLVGIATNLNQIARLANSGKMFSNHEAQLVQAVELIRGLLT